MNTSTVSTTIYSAVANFTDREDITVLPTIETPLFPKYVYTIFGMMLSITASGGFLLNGTALIVFMKHKQLRSPTNVFIISLVLGDFLMCAVATPWSMMSNYAGHWLFGPTGCAIEGFLVYLLGCNNLYSLCAVSVDRYVVIAKPLHAAKITHRVALAVVFGCLLGGLFWSATPFFGWNYYQLEGAMTSCSVAFNPSGFKDKSYIIAIFIFVFIIPLGLIFFSYYHVYMTVRSVSRNSVWDMTSRVARKNLRIEKKMAKTIGLMIGVYLLSWGPYAIVSFWSAFGDSSSLPALLAAVPPFLAKSSTIWNPIIYVATNKQFRCAFYSLLPCTSLKDKLVKKEEEKAASSKESDLDDKTKTEAPPPTKTTQVKPLAVEEPSQGVSQVEATVVEELSPPNSAKGGRKPEGTEMKELKS